MEWAQNDNSIAQCATGSPKREREQSMDQPPESTKMGTSEYGPPPAPSHLTYFPVNKILGDDDGGREHWELLFHTIFLLLPFSPIMEGASFLLSRPGYFLYFKAWQFWSMGGSVSHKRTACRTEMQTYNFCPCKSCLFQWTFSGRPGSVLDSFSSCSIAKQHGRANTGKQGSRERGNPRKMSRSNVLTIFLCLICYILSLSLSDHCRTRWHSPRNRNSGETDWCIENSNFKNKGPQSWQRSPCGCLWTPADHQTQRWTLQLPLEEEVKPTHQRTRAVQHLQRIFAYFLNATLVLLQKEGPSSASV